MRVPDRPARRRRFAVTGLLAAVLLAVAGVWPTAVAQAQPDQRLAWAFNETSGSTVQDVSTNRTTGTASNTTRTTAGRFAGALVFNGSSSRVRSDSNIALSGAFTFSAWVFNPSRQNDETIMGVGSSRNLVLDNGVVEYDTGLLDYSFGSALPTNTWQYVSLVSTGSTVRAYVNGVQLGSARNVSSPATTDRLQVGSRNGLFGLTVDEFSGTIDEVRVHNRALTPAEIVADQNSAITSDAAAPVLSGGAPTGSQPAGTTRRTLQVTTNEAATCRYGTTAGTAYAALPTAFGTTGGTAHSTEVTGLTDGTSYTYYVRCADAAGNATTADYPIAYSVASPAPSVLGPWSGTTSLPAPRSANGAVAANGFLYLVGGIDASGAAVPTVYVAPTSAGAVGAWTTTTPLPVPVRSTRPVIANGFMYVAGGSDGNATSATVHYAPVNANGTLGTWRTTTPLPQAQLSHSTVATGGYLYVLGGNPGPCIDTVISAPINPDGTIGAWTPTTSLPAPRCGFVEAVTEYRGVLYSVGGYDNFGLSSAVWSSRVGPGGTLGPWQTSAAGLLDAREYHAVEAVDGRLIVIGGQLGVTDTITSRVEQAVINADGSVGPFSAAPPLLAPRSYMGTAVVGNTVYAVGGGIGTTGEVAQDSVYAAVVGPPAAAARTAAPLGADVQPAVPSPNPTGPGG